MLNGFRTSIAALLLLPVALQAQQKKIRFGVLSGLSSSSVSDVNQALDAGGVVTTSRRTGIDVGTFVQLGINSMLSVQPEVHFAQRGINFSGQLGEAGDPLLEASLKMNYVEVPVLVRLDLLPSTAKVRPMFVLGPSVSVRMSCKLKVDAPQVNFAVETNCDEDPDGGANTDDPITKKDFSIIGGGGASFALGPVSLLVQARYSHGLTNISADKATNNNATIRNSAFSFLVGVGF